MGGGSPWGKDATKADVTLNHYARKLAINHLKDNDECFVYLSSCIGKSNLPSAEIRYVKEGTEHWKKINVDTLPSETIHKLGFHQPVFKSLCKASVGIECVK